MMFKNPGKEIKNIATVIFFLGIVASIIGGFVLVKHVHVFWGIITVVVGSLGTYIATLLLAGFGELIETNADNRDINKQTLQLLQIKTGYSVLGEDSQNPPTAQESKKIAADAIICPNCGAEQNASNKNCWRCDTPIKS